MQDRHAWIFAAIGALLILVLIGIWGTWNHFIGVFVGLEDTFGMFVKGFFLVVGIAAGMGLLACGVRLYWMLFKTLKPTSEGNYEALVSVTGRVITVDAGNGPVPHTYNYRVDTHQPKMLAAPDVIEAEVDRVVEEAVLPGPCDLSDVLDVWRPTRSEILLGFGPGGQKLLVPLKSLCHVALAGSTGGGKSVLMRLILAQILATGCRVALADPHFAPVDPESGEDWRPIASRLAIEPAVSYAAIHDVLDWMAYSELPSRLEKRRNSQPVGDPFFLAMDELPAIIANIENAPDAMATILREGRKVGLFLISAAQDWLVKTVGGSGGVRDCFRTAFYVGGDSTTARVLLDVKGKVDDGTLGKGVVMLRSQATPQAALTRVPYVSNDALFDLLSESFSKIPTAQTTAPMVDVSLHGMSLSTTAQGPEVGKNRSDRPLDARALRIRELVRSGKLPSKIIEEVWGISARTGGKAYMEAARELAELMSGLV